MERNSRLVCSIVLVAGCILLQQGCAPFKASRVAAVGLTLQDVAQAAAKQADLTIIREGSPAYLMLLDGLLEAYPQNTELLTSACRAYSSYASSFLSDEQQAEAGALYQKAKLYGFRALSTNHDFAAAAAGNLEEFQALLQGYDKTSVPALFCAVNAWASWISGNLDKVEAIADLAPLEATMRRLLELDESYYYGGPRLLMGVYLAAKPKELGGNPAEALQQFERAFALGADQLLMSKVLYAQYYARSIKNRQLYEETLQLVLASPADRVPELTLANTVAKREARNLLDKTEEYFAEQP
ncbi:TRAP transporter TatT component family protein [Desulfoferrobacter suflitae]|uniref:TRAP transporter TatT component family protein n=1 Tax=Desulfoferrobacter suflitae TaxID=2865782 RepID=UPI002164D2D8|nr:TRAP transporter TatT component family protein [Desulfoferrobacter suflitae]MCK8601684.1 TRAP transporter TatT component family protein [Desulfoferrobacter suflitae]